MTSPHIRNWITTTYRSCKIGLGNTSKKILKSLATHTTIMLKGLYWNLSVPICANVKTSKITKQQQRHLMHIMLQRQMLHHYFLWSSFVIPWRIQSPIHRCRANLWSLPLNLYVLLTRDHLVCQMRGTGVQVQILHSQILPTGARNSWINSLASSIKEALSRKPFPANQRTVLCGLYARNERPKTPVCCPILCWPWLSVKCSTDKEYCKGVHWLETLRLHKTKTLDAGYTVSSGYTRYLIIWDSFALFGLQMLRKAMGK